MYFLYSCIAHLHVKNGMECILFAKEEMCNNKNKHEKVFKNNDNKKSAV